MHFEYGLAREASASIVSVDLWNATFIAKIFFIKLFLTKELISQHKKCNNGMMAELEAK